MIFEKPLYHCEYTELAKLAGQKSYYRANDKGDTPPLGSISKDQLVELLKNDFNTLPELQQRNIKIYCENHEIKYYE